MPKVKAAADQPEGSHMARSAARDTRFGGLFCIQNKVEAVVPRDPNLPPLLKSLIVVCHKATGTSADCGK